MTMDPMQIFWLFFMLTALQPVITQRLLEASRKRMIALIEQERKSRVVLLVHRQETMSLLGFPVFRYIDINDSEEVLRAIHLTDPEIPIDLVLHTQRQGHSVCPSLCYVGRHVASARRG